MGHSLSYLDNLLPELTTYNVFWSVVINEDIRPLLFPLLIAYKSRIKVLNVILYTDPFLGLILLPSSLDKSTLPICNTERFKNYFINRLSFNYNLAISN